MESRRRAVKTGITDISAADLKGVHRTISRIAEEIRSRMHSYNTPRYRNHIGGRYHLSGNVLPVGCGAIYSFGVRDTRIVLDVRFYSGAMLYVMFDFPLDCHTGNERNSEIHVLFEISIY
ncbi:hypothetical protein CDAR_601771 [Caerostris darwini]|uniref:Uncharacterized protein n=1 Tax=Caerostris darwini TaxID=1538125 RepID=A0AAV4ML11_9ARAC|nr:hypothetical protein CDAR_601771 [Caerostris darwini]